MTYNVRGYFPCDTFKIPSHHWYYRKQHIIDIIDKEQPDILALQEIFNIPAKISGNCNDINYTMGYLSDKLVSKGIKELSKQNIKISPPRHLIRDFIREKLKMMGYSFFYKSGGSPKMIFYKKNKFTIISGGQFYQNKKKSTTYVFLKDKDDKTFLVVNTHLVAGKTFKNIRESSINYITNKLLQINPHKYPLILLGDFNIDYLTNEYKKLVKILSKKLKIIENSDKLHKNYTFHAFGEKNKRIDYIFYSKELKLTSSKILKVVYSIKKDQLLLYNKISKNIIFPSDHWPLINYFILE